MTFAIAEALRKTQSKHFNNLDKQAIKEMKKFGKLYSQASYGTNFRKWLMQKNPQLYNSFGNGSAMRISPVPYFAKSLEEVKILSNKVTAVTHNHIEGIKGAEATAVAIWLASHGSAKEEIKKYIQDNYYGLDFDYEELKKTYYFNESCQNTAPQAIYCFLISNDFEDCVRTSVSIGGDTDTLCAISCVIAEAYYGIPKEIVNQALMFLDDRLYELYDKYYKTSTKVLN